MLNDWLGEGRERPEKIAAAARCLEKTSPPVAELLDALDGKPAATHTHRRRRAVVSNTLEYAVELGTLPSNPLGRIRRKHGRQPVQETDRHVVANPRQTRELLTR